MISTLSGLNTIITHIIFRYISQGQIVCRESRDRLQQQLPAPASSSAPAENPSDVDVTVIALLQAAYPLQTAPPCSHHLLQSRLLPLLKPPLLALLLPVLQPVKGILSVGLS